MNHVPYVWTRQLIPIPKATVVMTTRSGEGFVNCAIILFFTVSCVTMGIDIDNSINYKRFSVKYWPNPCLKY